MNVVDAPERSKFFLFSVDPSPDGLKLVHGRGLVSTDLAVGDAVPLPQGRPLCRRTCSRLSSLLSAEAFQASLQLISHGIYYFSPYSHMMGSPVYTDSMVSRKAPATARKSDCTHRFSISTNSACDELGIIQQHPRVRLIHNGLILTTVFTIVNTEVQKAFR